MKRTPPTNDHILTPAELDRIADRAAERIAEKLAGLPVLMDKRTLAMRIGLSESTIERRVAEGVIPRIKDGRRVLFHLPSVVDALMQRDTPADAQP